MNNPEPRDMALHAIEPGDITSTLFSKVIQIQTAFQPSDANYGPHLQLFVLCEDGSVWSQNIGTGHSKLWHNHAPPNTKSELDEQELARTRRIMEAVGNMAIHPALFGSAIGPATPENSILRCGDSA